MLGVVLHHSSSPPFAQLPRASDTVSFVLLVAHAEPDSVAMRTGVREAVRLLLAARADALARNAAGEQPHKLAESGSALWRVLAAELSWRATLEQPRLCHYVDAGAEPPLSCTQRCILSRVLNPLNPSNI